MLKVVTVDGGGGDESRRADVWCLQEYCCSCSHTCLTVRHALLSSVHQFGQLKKGVLACVTLYAQLADHVGMCVNCRVPTWRQQQLMGLWLRCSVQGGLHQVLLHACSCFEREGAVTKNQRFHCDTA